MSASGRPIEACAGRRGAALISVIVPVYNRASYLAEALDSVFAQRYRPLEVIVVDDGSTDGSGDVARSYSGTRVIEQAHGGIARARNTGIVAARGDLLAFQDSDDIWSENKLAVQAHFMLTHPQVDFTLAGMRNFVDPGDKPPTWFNPDLLHTTMVGIGSTLMTWRRVFDRVGLFDASCTVGEDVDWVLRARESGATLSVLKDALLWRRLHESNATRDPDECANQFMGLLRRSVQRKRAASALRATANRATPTCPGATA